MPHIFIVGAGVFGLAVAWELRTRGWEVDVIDPGPVPRPSAASTDISRVIRMDYGPDGFYTALAEAALAGWDEWNRRWDPPLYHEDGFLLLAPEAMRPGGFEYDSAVALGKRGHSLLRLPDLPRVERFPAWSPATYPDGARRSFRRGRRTSRAQGGMASPRFRTGRSRSDTTAPAAASIPTMFGPCCRPRWSAP